MKNKNRLLESLSQELGSQISLRRYSLSELLSESYKVAYLSLSEEDSNLRKLAECHINDLKNNPRDIERLSRNLGILKELVSLKESGEIRDEDLVDKDYYDEVEPKKRRVIQDIKENTKDSQIEECDANEKEELKEADDPELTDEELEELAKHLETIRKERKESPKKEVGESSNPRRGIKCSMKETKKEVGESSNPRRGIKCSMKETKKEELKEEANRVYQYDIDIIESPEDSTRDMEDRISRILQDADIRVVGCRSTDTSWDISEYGISESKEEKIEDCSESKSYKGLDNFRKLSESKAFYKTFKKLHNSLKEGKALTRQESIDLYKASNSALTQLSIELEHNPDFLDTFKESVSLLSKDVNSLLESLTRGKAPSKATMKSLAKFSESLLCEDTVHYPNGVIVSDNSVDMDKALDYMYGTDRDKDNSKYSVEEKQRAINYWIERTDPIHESEEDHPEYLADFSVVDTKKVGSYEIQICTFSDHEGYGVQVVDSEGNPLDTDREIDDLTFDKFFKTEAEAREVANKLVPILSKKYSVNESEEDNPEDFVGDDEGDMQSEEAEAFDQEYADARVELHKDLEDKHADDEDPSIQDKLAQDKEEVVNLPGTTEEQAAELNGEEETPVESDTEEEDNDDEDEVVDDITDEELAELKKHLTEMRAARKSN